MATSSGFTFDQSFDSDDEDIVQKFSAGHDACVFVIDCSQSMFEEFEENEETTSLFIKCLSVLERLLLNKIISNNKELVGVILYNVLNSPNPDEKFKMETQLIVPKSTAILLPLKLVDVEQIQYVKNLKYSDDLMDFNNKFGHSSDGKVSDILWLCSSMFSSAGQKLRVPQIMWYTNEDQPHQVGSQEFQQAFQKAKDLQQLQLDLQFYPMKTDFDGDLFYKELLCQLLNIDSDDFQFPTPQLKEKELFQRMFRRAYNKRAVSYLTVELSDKAKFGVGIYSFARNSSVPKPIILSRTSNEQIITKRDFKFSTVPDDGDDDDANLDFKDKLEPSMMIKYQQCGGEKIKFTPLEAYEIKQVMEPKIKVLGFKPSSVLSEHNHIKCPYFIYPSDNFIKNSSMLFRTLWERCLELDKVVICIFQLKLKSFPRLAALVPQEQTNGSDGEILRYDGFRLEIIPFAGDLRDLSEVFPESLSVDSAISAVMKKITGKLRINFCDKMFSNPVITNIYSKIEEQTFNEEADEDTNKDPTLPNQVVQDERITEFLDQLHELIGGFEEVIEKPQKRKATDAPSQSQRQKILAEGTDYSLVLKKCEDGETKDLTIPILKAYLESKGVKGLSKLTKPGLIEKIIEIN